MKKVSFNEGWIYNGQPVTLPHDAKIHANRRADAPSEGAGAFFEDGEYVYEKTFAKPEEEHVILQFEGVYKNAKVYLNDALIAEHAYGYAPFFVTLDEHLKEGENTIRVECAVVSPDSRWYSGAGIYRPVWLYVGDQVGIEPESVKISTVSYDPAMIRVQSPVTVRAFVDEANVSDGGTDFTLEIPNAKLWSEEHPYLYKLRVVRGTDEVEIPFGIRKVEWSNKGLFINGKSVLLRGGCLHHDNGVVGAATYDESEWRCVKILKDGGFNAIRSAHNPTSRALLEACDALGVYVMDETWDMWFHHKTFNDYATEWRENYLADIDAMVNRDFNHPSVILYSIGNEVSEPAKDEGVAKTREMVEHIHAIDPNRAVTGGFNLMIISSAKKGKGIYNEEGGRKSDSDGKAASGMNSTMFNLITSMLGAGMNKSANSKAADEATSPSLDLLDLAGYNYASGRYPLEAKAHPDRVIFGSETFPQTIAQNWAMVEKYPYLVGDFMWTAWDYIGEAGIGSWAYTDDARRFDKPYPWLLADAGAFDILGDPNGEAFQAAAVWKKLDAPQICVQPINHDKKPAKGAWRGTNAIPSWSFAGCDGKKAVVEVYTEGARVELYLNGKSVGKAKVKNAKATFKVVYVPGTLRCVAYDASGREIGSSELVSATGTKTVKIEAEKKVVKPGEVVYLPVTVVGKNDVVESNADVKVKVTVENGELLGFGSANPRTEERFDAGEYTTYYGKAMAVVRAGEAGVLKVAANEAVAEVTVE